MTRITLVRFWLPLVVTVAGAVITAIGFARGEDTWAEGGGLIVSAGLSIWLLNVLHRMGVSGDRARDEEDDARAFFDRHGVWPDEVSAERRRELERRA